MKNHINKKVSTHWCDYYGHWFNENIKNENFYDPRKSELYEQPLDGIAHTHWCDYYGDWFIKNFKH